MSGGTIILGLLTAMVLVLRDDYSHIFNIKMKFMVEGSFVHSKCDSSRRDLKEKSG